MSTTFLLVCFLSLSKSTWLGKMFFIALQKLSLFSRKSNFRILHFQISWRYQMPKHKTRNKHSLVMKFGQFMSYCKRKNFIKKYYKNYGLKTNSRPVCIYRKLSATSFGKWNFWSKLLILDMLSESCQNLSKSVCWLPPNHLHRGFFKN